MVQFWHSIQWFRVALVAGALVLLTACSSTRPWINQPLAPGATGALPIVPVDHDPSLLVAVTLSGGGARAAAFGYGVLNQMQSTRFAWSGGTTSLLESTDLVSGVSGGSIVAAYLAAYGADRLAQFEPDFLRQNFQNSLILQALRPVNLQALSSPWFGRTHLLAQRLDALYGGMRFGDLPLRKGYPQLLVTATDLSLGTGFEFSAEQFTAICSDLASVPLSFAVAASSAVPLVLSPVTLHNYAARCADSAAVRGVASARPLAESYRTRLFHERELSYLDASARPFIHLVDGGLSDNLGLQRLLDRVAVQGGLRASLAGAGVAPGSIRKLVLIAVNAERDPAFDIDVSDRIPSVAQVVDAMLFGTGARATRETQEFLLDTARQWQRSLLAQAPEGTSVFAEDAQIHVIPVNLRDAADTLFRRRLLQIPTAFTIGPDEVTDLIAAGAQVLRDAPEFQALSRSLGVSQSARPRTLSAPTATSAEER